MDVKVSGLFAVSTEKLTVVGIIVPGVSIEEITTVENITPWCVNARFNLKLKQKKSQLWKSSHRGVKVLGLIR